MYMSTPMPMPMPMPMRTVQRTVRASKSWMPVLCLIVAPAMYSMQIYSIEWSKALMAGEESAPPACGVNGATMCTLRKRGCENLCRMMP